MLGVKALDQVSVVVRDDDPLIGLNLGGFVVKKLLAAGGMGLVYEALHEQIGRRAAVKVLRPEVATDQEWSRRFLTEAQALASLKNKNLIEVLNFGKTPDGREFLMMEFLEGEALDHYIQRLGALTPAVALGITEQILNALSEAHKKGVVHRDLKPSNVFLLREHSGELLVKVIDFGLARQEPVKLLEAAIALPTTPDGSSLLAGTPEYIAPEQAQGRKVDHAADLYSLGVMLYEMLSGALPFQAASVTALLQKHLSERPPLLSSQVSNLPEGVEALVDQLLEKDPAKRPSSADAARVQVQRLLKRLAQDSTAVRVSPNSLPTVKVDPTQAPKTVLPTDRIARPTRSSDQTELALSTSARGPWRWVALGGGLAAVVLALLWFLRPAPPPVPMAAAPAVVVAPAPVPAEPVETAPVQPATVAPVAPKAPAPVEKAAAPTPTKVALEPATKVVVQRAPVPEACNDLAGWKVSMQREMAALEGRAARDDALYEALGKVPTGFGYAAATDAQDCARVEKALDEFYAQHGLAR
jgi:serine/threonine protein kinase